MKSNDFVKYITVQLVKWMERPNKKNKGSRKTEGFMFRWFGLIPLSLKVMAKRFQKNA